MPALTITNAGRQAAIDAANQGMTVRIETLAVGSGRYTPDGTETALQTQLASVAIANARQLGDQLALYSLFTSGTWTAYELGLFLDDGSLFAVVSDGAAGQALYTKDAANLAITTNLLLTTVPLGSVTVQANLLFDLGDEFVRKAGDTMTGDLLTVTPPQADDSKKAVNSEWVRRFFGAASLHEYRTAGNHSLTWDHQTERALVVLVGGGGGDGAGGNAGANDTVLNIVSVNFIQAPRTPTTAPDGGDGGDTTLQVDGNTYTADGGVGGSGGPNGGNGIYFDPDNSPGIVVIGGDNGTDLDGGGAGADAAAVVNGARGGNGGNGQGGQPGAVVTQEISGLSDGDVFTIVVGAGGTRGQHTQTGALIGADGPNDGDAGYVAIIPLY